MRDFFLNCRMISKKIILSTHQVNVAFVESIAVRSAKKKVSQENTMLFFLHEALGSIPQWRSFPQLLCDALGMHGCVIERRGHGESDELAQDRTARYLHQAAYEELHELIQLLLPAGKKAVLIGHSDGGTIALLYAAKFPKQIAGVVTMAAHVVNEEVTRRGIHPAIEAYKAGKLDGLKKYHGTKTETLFYAWANTWLSEAFKAWNIVSDIQGIQAPTLVIQGDEDQYGTEEQLKLIQQAVPTAQLEMMVGVKHHPHLEQTDDVVEMIRGFLVER